MDTILTIVKLLGGLGLFIYGMKLMGDGLENAAGEGLKKILEKVTKNPIIAVVVGAVVTMVIQSSSATTVMVVGFVNAGLMGLPQAVGVIMGANIGTTITAQIVSFDLTGLAPLALGIGILLYLFGGSEKYKQVGEVFIGFGLLFTGMESMKVAVNPLAEYKGFTDLLATFGRYPILGLLLGFGITAIIQSSSAAMGMLVVLASQGLVPLASALPILYGQNIGTCVTSLISSIGANKNAKRAAMIHLIFNILGTIIFLVFLNRFVVDIVVKMDPNNVARQIANVHTIFNIVSTLLLLPCNKLIVKLAMKIVPDKNDETEEDESRVIKYIDDRMIQTPPIALASTIKEVSRMGEKARYSVDHAMEGILEASTDAIEKSFKQEKIINQLQKTILNYLLKLSKAPLSEEDRETVDALFNTVNDIERIGDHAENLAEIAQSAIDGQVSFSEQGQNEISDMYNKVISSYTYALEAMVTSDVHLACKVIKMEEQVDIMEESCRVNHMRRLNNNLCSIDNGIIYLEILSNLERISDHAANIAEKVIQQKTGDN